MEFGTQAFFDRLYQGVADGDVQIYEELDGVITRSVGGMVASKIPASEREDVLQEIKLTVWKHLSSFLRTSAGHTPAQRDAWLRQVAQSRINDYFRSRCFSSEAPDGTGPHWAFKEQPLEDYEADRKETALSAEEALMAKLRNKEDQQTCNHLMSHVCSLRISPERIIAFFYNAIIFPLSADKKRKKGDPTALLQSLSGRELEELAVQMKRDLALLFGHPVPDWVFTALDNRIRDCPKQVFSMTGREITVISSRTRTSLCGNRDKILGGICDE